MQRGRRLGQLADRFEVRRTDTGELVENCFVLCPETDHAAALALRVYARVTKNAETAARILQVIGPPRQSKDGCIGTDLTGKCGGCAFSEQMPNGPGGSKCFIVCKQPDLVRMRRCRGHGNILERTHKACTKYRSKGDGSAV